MIDLLSYNNLPMSVLFPSSTLPAVMNRKISMITFLKISALLPVFHCSLRNFIVYPCFTSFTDFGCDNLINNFFNRIGIGFNGSRASHVTNRAVAHFFIYDFIALLDFDKRREGNQLTLVLKALALMSKIDRRKF